MIGRRQLTVASPISPFGLLRAFADSLGDATTAASQARERVIREFKSSEALLTDSGTSALVLALRLAAPNGGIVAYPGYACVDLAAAARFAGVRIRLYDLDPDTLSPDLDSVAAVIRRGVDAIVVAHLFGYPADVLAVRDLASASGVTVIEDAAQGAGGSLRGKRLGSLGALSIVSFGRGKGLCAGGGGALLASDPKWAERLRSVNLSGAGRGWPGLAKAAIQWALGRPSVYALPSMIPWLRLGQMVYHPASEPRAMDVASNALLRSAFELEESDLVMRRRNAAELEAAVAQSPELRATTPIAGANAGYLRFAVRELRGSRAVEGSLGIARPYPVTMAEQEELRPVLMSGEPSIPGAVALRDSLFTLPSHRFVSRVDVAALGRWMTVSGASDPVYDLSRARAQ